MRTWIAFLAGALAAAGLFLAVQRYPRSKPEVEQPLPEETTAVPTEQFSPQAAPSAPGSEPEVAPTRAPEETSGPRLAQRRAPASPTSKGPNQGQAQAPAASPAASPPPADLTPERPPAQVPAASQQATSATEPVRREPRRVTLPAGYLLKVRLAQSLSSAENKPGDRFTATLDDPVVVDGLVIAERGARVEGRVVEVEKAGRVKGLASITLQLTRLHTSDGQVVEIQTDPFEKLAPPSRKADAAKIAAGAAIGAAIGAIADGGKGAAIGAAAGGGAGTGAVLATRGKPAELPVESRLVFRLQHPVTITEKVE